MKMTYTEWSLPNFDYTNRKEKVPFMPRFFIVVQVTLIVVQASYMIHTKMSMFQS